MTCYWMAKIIHNWSQRPLVRETLSKSYCQPKISLDGLTPRRSHVRRGNHIYPRAITSCPGHALCLTWQFKCTCSGDHIRAWCRELKCFAWYCNSWHQARMWSPLHVHLTCQVRHRLCPGQDVIARGYMWSPRRTCDRRGVRPSRLKL